MDSRARKRMEADEPQQTVRDKRACSSSGIRSGEAPSEELPKVQAAGGPSSSVDRRTVDHEMESTSVSSSSVHPESGSIEESSCSDGGEEDDDDDPETGDDAGHHNVVRAVRVAYACSKSREKIKSVLSSLGEEAEAGTQLAALTELCEMLSFGSEDSLSSLVADSFAQALVRLAGHESNPEMMLLAIRALAYLCDVLPRSATAIVKHGALPVLCGRLMSIEYLDVAEQGIQALEKISYHQPVPCLKAGAITAVLTYVDFFTTSIQRVALSTVATMCKKVPSDCSPHVLEAIPTLCSLLHYDDGKIVETAVICLKRISENFSSSSDLLDDLCKHGLVKECVSLIASGSGGRPSLSQETYIDLIRLLTGVVSNSLVAFKALFELNIGSTLRGILETADVSRSVSHSFRGSDHANQIHEVLKLLAQLLPSGPREDKDIQLVLCKEKILVEEESKYLHQLCKDILPVLIQVVNAGASPTICYGCITLINSMAQLSSSVILFDLFSESNFSSFLAGLLSRKDIHVLNSSLEIAQVLLTRQGDVFMGPFIKEGVAYAIDYIQLPDSHASTISNSGKMTVNELSRCYCHILEPSFSMPHQADVCKLENAAVLALAKQIKSTYFNTVAEDIDVGVTNVLQKLKALCGSLTDNIQKFLKVECSQDEECLTDILRAIMEQLSGEHVSTFEFIGSGIARSLVHYLSNGVDFEGHGNDKHLQNHLFVVQKRFQAFASICLSKTGQNGDMLLKLLVQSLQNALSSVDQFPVVSSIGYEVRNVCADIPFLHSTMHPCLKVHFISEDDSILNNCCEKVLTVKSSSSFDEIENFLWRKISTRIEEESAEKDNNVFVLVGKCGEQKQSVASEKHGKFDEPQRLASSLLEVTINQEMHIFPMPDARMTDRDLPRRNAVFTDPTDRTEINSPLECASRKLSFYLEGKLLDRSLTLYQAILNQQLSEQPDMFVEQRFWNTIYKVTYKTADPRVSMCRETPTASQTSSCNRSTLYWPRLPFISCIVDDMLPCALDNTKPSYDILFLLKILEGLNQVGYKLLFYERINAFAEGDDGVLDFKDLKCTTSPISPMEFLNNKLTEKLEQQMRDPLSVSSGSMPPWCGQLMAACPFLFSFEARWKYVCLTVFKTSLVQQKALSPRGNSSNSSRSTDNQRVQAGNFSRKRFQVDRTHVLESAIKVMSSHILKEAILEVEFIDEVGIGLGPTLEFYTLVSHELQKIGLGLWKGDNNSISSMKNSGPGYVTAPLGLFPLPWSASAISSNEIQFNSVKQHFSLLGKVVAKALQDGRTMDLPLSKAFYKLMLDQELDLYDIQLFDPELGSTLLEFQALVCRRRILESTSGEEKTWNMADLLYRGTRIEDLSLDFTLPGHPDYLLSSGNSSNMVNINNLEEYVSFVVDATIGSGISKQVEAFKSGFNEVLPLSFLQVLTEEELERLLCGEQNSWTFDELADHIKFDHGYTGSSPPVINLLETILEFGRCQQRAFLQFVTGSPRLPLGGFAALSPKLTVVRKHCSEYVDMELPSVMTCANYLKLPPYSSKEVLQARLLYAITEGQGSFHLS